MTYPIPYFKKEILGYNWVYPNLATGRKNKEVTLQIDVDARKFKRKQTQEEICLRIVDNQHSSAYIYVSLPQLQKSLRQIKTLRDKLRSTTK